MKKTYYLDWRPRASHAIEPTSFDFEISDLIFKLRTYADRNKFPSQLIDQYIEDVKIAARTDGIFIFAVQWKDAAPTDRPIEFNLACLISQYIKIELKHVHLYDRHGTSIVRAGDWAPIHKTPVKIKLASASADQPLAKCVENDADVLLLSADTIPFEDTQPIKNTEALALLRLRDKYTRAFDRTFRWLGDIRHTNYLGLSIYRRYSYFYFLFAVLVVSITVHNSYFNSHPYSGVSYLEVLVAGALNTFCLGLVVAALSKAWTKYLPKGLETIVERAFDRLHHVVKPQSLTVFRSKLPRMPSLMSKPEFLWAAVIAGPFVLSLKEMPSLLELAKVLKIDFGVHWVEQVARALSTVSAVEAFRREGFLFELFGAALFYLPLLIVWIYTLEISMKRRKILRALWQLRGVLLFGNIYNAVADGVFYRARRGDAPKEFDYRWAIEIVDDFAALERRKRMQSQARLAAALAVAFYFSWSSYAEMVRTIFTRV